MQSNSRLNFVERRIVGSENVPLHVLTYGDSTHRPVLLLHGGGQTCWSWSETAKALAKQGFYCLTPDARGHGRSGRSENYRLADFAADVSAITQTLCAQPPVTVGASMGGVASVMTQAEAQLFRALVLVDVVPDWDPEGISRIIGFLSAHPDGFDSLDAAATAVASYLSHRRRPPSSDGLKRNLTQRDDGRWVWHWDPRMLEAADEHVTQWPGLMRTACTRIDIPTLLISGARSEVVSQEGADRLLKLIPHAQHRRIENAHHMVAGDSNQTFTETVLTFLHGLDNRPTDTEDPLCLVS
ncbi:MAG: alpha/beta hydrolase [Pseudomonadota bacterium]